MTFENTALTWHLYPIRDRDCNIPVWHLPFHVSLLAYCLHHYHHRMMFNNLLTNGKPGLWTWTNFTPQMYINFLFWLLWYKFLYLFIWGLDSERQLRLFIMWNLSPMLLTVNSVILPIGFPSTNMLCFSPVSLLTVVPTVFLRLG